MPRNGWRVLAGLKFHQTYPWWPGASRGVPRVVQILSHSLRAGRHRPRRLGALRLRDVGGSYLSTADEGKRTTPPLISLEKIFAASRAVENSTETAEDLKYLQGKGTSLGGMRPKCTVLDENERLAIDKFPTLTVHPTTHAFRICRQRQCCRHHAMTRIRMPK